MGVYVKGMEMPKNCRACRLKMNCDDCEGFECVCLPLHTQIGYLNDLLTDKRRDDCPLAPVPEPHGRLIDADSLMNEFKILQSGREIFGMELDSSFLSSGQELSTEWYCVEDAIEDAPTIIEAEEW